LANVLGINAVFHDPAAALVVDGVTVAASEEERFSRRKHGKEPVPFSTWEMPVCAVRAVLEEGGVDPADVDVVAYSYDPGHSYEPGSPTHAEGPTVAGDLGAATVEDLIDDDWESLRSLYAERAQRFLLAVMPALGAARFRHVAHHVAHAASAWGGAPFDSCAVMVVDGRGESTSYLAGVRDADGFHPLAHQGLPHSLGLRYEELTAHLGFRRSSDEYKVMALAAYGEPVHLDEFRSLIHADGNGGFRTCPIDWGRFAPAVGDGEIDRAHADLASTVQVRLEEVLLDLAAWLADETGQRRLAMAGGVALNCVANSRLHRDGPFDEVWVQPAAGDSGTALGAAMAAADELGDRVRPMGSAALGPTWSDGDLEDSIRAAGLPYERPDDVADCIAAALAEDRIVGWFQGRSEYGPRALGHRSLLAHPGPAANLERLNDVKGREQFRPIAPMVLLESAEEIFSGGPIPSPYMLFTHRVAPAWRERIPAVVHVDGTARIQTIDPADEPLVHRMIDRFRARTGIPVVVNTSFNTAGRPIVEHPREALECFGSAPIDLLALGPFVVRRAGAFT
jgi:carbamoyltransferase